LSVVGEFIEDCSQDTIAKTAVRHSMSIYIVYLDIDSASFY
jgi:hypothetical protein